MSSSGLYTLTQQQQQRNLSAATAVSDAAAAAASSDEDGGFLKPRQCRRRSQQQPAQNNSMVPTPTKPLQQLQTKKLQQPPPPSPPPPPPPRRASLNQLNLALPISTTVIERPKTCKLSAALRKRAHNHYLPGCMKLSELQVRPTRIYFANGDSSSIASSALQSTAEASFRDARADLAVSVAGSSGWLVTRSLTDLVAMDAALHRCCLQRGGSSSSNLLIDLGAAFADARCRLSSSESKSASSAAVEQQQRRRFLSELEAVLMEYFLHFSALLPIVGDRLTCPMVLDPLEINCNGLRLTDIDRYNTQAVELAVVIADFQPEADDELELRIGDYVALTHVTVNMDQPTWWQGKIVSLDAGCNLGCESAAASSSAAGQVHGCSHLGLQQPPKTAPPRIGFFPSNCVQILAGRDTSDLRPTPIRARFGTLLPALRAFFRSRPDASDLRPSGILRPALFGSDLSSASAAGQWGRGDSCLPPILLHCCRVVESHGCQQQGIYRRSGSASEIQQLREAFEHCWDESSGPQLRHALHNVQRCLCDSDESIFVGSGGGGGGRLESCPLFKDVHNYASLLKSFFRELAVPLLGGEFIDCAPADGRAIRNSLLLLPPAHIRVASFLFHHLNRMSAHSDETLMSSRNLGLVWAPSLCHQLLSPVALDDLATVAKQSQQLADVVAYVIDHCAELFPPACDVNGDSAASSSGIRSNPLGASIRRVPSNRNRQQQQHQGSSHNNNNESVADEAARMRQACQQLYCQCPRSSAPKRRPHLLQPLSPPSPPQPTLPK